VFERMLDTWLDVKFDSKSSPALFINVMSYMHLKWSYCRS
jgi:hypothetical protein